MNSLLPGAAGSRSPEKGSTDSAACAALPRLYRDLATWYRLLTPREEYAGEAAAFHVLFEQSAQRPLRSLLELGCGAGHNAWYLKSSYTATLSDLSPEMLALSREINPECEHVLGDMRTLRLGRQFDVVFVHDAVSYLTTEADLHAAIETAFLHCAPGGVALFMPDCTRETFEPGTDTGGVDRDGRGLRYLEWSWDPDPTDTSYITDMAIMTRERDGSAEVTHDRHHLGLFSRERWLRLLSGAGFTPRAATPPDGSPDFGEAEIFIAVRPGDRPG
jgi:SAM-dependent methyltransferase